MKKVVCLFFIILVSFCLVGCESSPQEIETINVEEVVINKSHAYVDIGDRIMLLAQVFPFNSTNQKINWKSDNENIASVSEGIVFGKSEGRTVVTAISDDGEFFDSCTVFVSSPKLNYELYPNNINNISQNLLSKDENIIKSQIETSCFDRLIERYEEIKNLIEEMFKTFQTRESVEENGEIDFENQSQENGVEGNIEEKGDEQNKYHGYYYIYQYNSEGIEDENKEDIIYKDQNTLVREKYF